MVTPVIGDPPGPHDPNAWPEQLAFYGAKAITALGACACGQATWVQYGSTYWCRDCARAWAWGVQPGQHGAPTTPNDGAPADARPALHVVKPESPGGIEW
jgi:hypothetical protein